MKTTNIFLVLGFLVSSLLLHSQINSTDIDQVESKVIKWRHHIHQNPELSNREFKTSEYVATHLKSLGMEVQTGVAHTGVVGILKGKKSGKVVALRADMDALPVVERNDLPYKSEVTSVFNGQETGVMHACGHDTHVAILMGVAEVLSKNRNFPGTVKFIFQPAEEGPPPGEEGGAKLMVKEGVLENPKVDAIFGLHINSGTHVGKITYKPGGMMAASQRFVIKVKGKQAHGSTPWQSVDPIVTSAQIINGLQTLISRESELTEEGAVISVGSIHSGIRFNIIPESLEMIGTIRTLNKDMKELIRKRMQEMVPAIAQAYRAEAAVDIQDGADITFNNEALTEKMIPTLERVAGKENVYEINAITGAEDFSYFQNEVPGLFFFLGGTPIDIKESEAPSHHTPSFIVDDDSMKLGVKALSNLAVDFLKSK
ncbi:MAG: N-acyl-L-amino acid amidohydrolase [Flavobacteriaceae bacterium TMED48]|nr:MAG: N-acyl-L-amino acid amidohydrolase [Flavobacteriaceae bacterium TMED48]